MLAASTTAVATTLAPYFHPTTACFIDDNESFLSGLELMLPETMSSVAFYDPKVALSFVNQPMERSLADRCFATQNGNRGTLVQLNTHLIEQEVNRAQRFSRVSVVIVDYSMPTLNGLEFCERIVDPCIGKVLLTGVADEKMAVEAFNAGIIDRFISKSHPQASEHIAEHTRAMETAYFYRQTEQLKRTLNLTAPGFLDDPDVVRHVQELRQRHRLCEYYLMTEPTGLLLLDAVGRIRQLRLMRARELDEQARWAEQLGAPADLVQRLRRHSHIGDFADGPDSYAADDPYPWGDRLYRAEPLGSPVRWYAALLDAPALDIDYHQEDRSFAHFVANQLG